jgi:hypothetical protein
MRSDAYVHGGVMRPGYKGNAASLFGGHDNALNIRRRMI